MEIIGPDLKKFNSSFKSCIFTSSGCILNSGSNAKFLFNTKEVIIRLQRNPGSDGKININGNCYIINQGIHILSSIAGNPLVISRPNTSVGQITFHSVIIEDKDSNNIKIETKKTKEEIMSSILDNSELLVFDSGPLNHLNITNSENTEDTGAGIRLGHTGSFIVHILRLQKGKDYIVSVLISPKDGNGKFGIKFCSPEYLLQNDSVGIVDGNKEFCTQVKCLYDETDEHHYYIQVYRPQHSSFGSINAHRIRVFEYNNADPLPPNSLVQIERVERYLQFKSEVIKKEEDKSPLVRKVFDQYQDSNKECSILSSEPLDVEKNNLSGVFELTNFSSLQWFNKINSFYPNIKPKYKGYRFWDKQSTTEETDIAFCTIYNLISAKRVFIEEFPITKDINIDALKQYEIIFTPSLYNKIFIDRITNKQSILTSRPWPQIPILQEKKDYSIYFEKSKEYTNKLISIWTEDLGELYIVGSTSEVPYRGHIKHISQYESYSIIYKLLLDSKRLIDISDCNYYMSGLIDLALSLDILVITNNNNYIGKASIITESIIESINKEFSYHLKYNFNLEIFK